MLRSADQLYEVLALICELMPALPDSPQLMLDNLPALPAAAVAGPAGAAAAAARLGGQEGAEGGQSGADKAKQGGSNGVAAQAVGAGGMGFRQQRPNGARGSGGEAGGAGGSSGALERAAYLVEHPELLSTLCCQLLPLLLQLHAATVLPQVRNKCLSAIVRLLAAPPPSVLADALEDVPIASFVATLLTARESSAAAAGLHMAEILMTQLPQHFSLLFVKEGVVHALDQLASKAGTTSGSASPAPQLGQGAAGEAGGAGAAAGAGGAGPTSAPKSTRSSSRLKEALLREAEAGPHAGTSSSLPGSAAPLASSGRRSSRSPPGSTKAGPASPPPVASKAAPSSASRGTSAAQGEGGPSPAPTSVTPRQASGSAPASAPSPPATASTLRDVLAVRAQRLRNQHFSTLPAAGGKLALDTPGVAQLRALASRLATDPDALPALLKLLGAGAPTTPGPPGAGSSGGSTRGALTSPTPSHAASVLSPREWSPLARRSHDAAASAGSVSVFELVSSGAVRVLCEHLQGRDLPPGPDRRAALLQRLRAFVEAGLAPDSGPTPPLLALVRKLLGALASMETFPVICSQLLVPGGGSGLGSSGSLSRHGGFGYGSLGRSVGSGSYGSGGAGLQGTNSLSSGLAALTQPFKLRLCRHSSERGLRDYGTNIVLIEPLASMTAIEDFLWPRVSKGLSSAASLPGQPTVNRASLTPGSGEGGATGAGPGAGAGAPASHASAISPTPGSGSRGRLAGSPVPAPASASTKGTAAGATASATAAAAAAQTLQSPQQGAGSGSRGSGRAGIMSGLRAALASATERAAAMASAAAATSSKAQPIPGDASTRRVTRSSTARARSTTTASNETTAAVTAPVASAASLSSTLTPVGGAGRKAAVPSPPGLSSHAGCMGVGDGEEVGRMDEDDGMMMGRGSTPLHGSHVHPFDRDGEAGDGEGIFDGHDEDDDDDEDEDDDELDEDMRHEDDDDDHDMELGSLHVHDLQIEEGAAAIAAVTTATAGPGQEQGGGGSLQPAASAKAGEASRTAAGAPSSSTLANSGLSLAAAVASKAGAGGADAARPSAWSHGGAGSARSTLHSVDRHGSDATAVAGAAAVFTAQPRLTFLSGSSVLPSSATVFQAIQQHYLQNGGGGAGAAGGDLDAEDGGEGVQGPGHHMWSGVHTLYYRSASPADTAAASGAGAGASPVQGSGHAASGSSMAGRLGTSCDRKPSGHSSLGEVQGGGQAGLAQGLEVSKSAVAAAAGVPFAALNALSEVESVGVQPQLATNDACREVLQLLQILEAINRVGPRLATASGMPSPGHAISAHKAAAIAAAGATPVAPPTAPRSTGALPTSQPTNMLSTAPDTLPQPQQQAASETRPDGDGQQGPATAAGQALALTLAPSALAAEAPVFGRVLREDFVSSKLASKLSQQLKDVLSICGGGLPAWCPLLVASSRHLFPFEVRRRYFYCTAFGLGRALQHMQALNAAEVGGGAGGAVDRDARGLRIGRLQRQKVRVSRKRILESAIKVMELYARQRAVLELEYFNEVGTGLGPTLEFYTLLSHDLQRRTLRMWRHEDAEVAPQPMHTDSDSTAPAASQTGGGERPAAAQHMHVEAWHDDSEYVNAPWGLFPQPLAPGSRARGGKVVEYFRLLGRSLGKALQDSRLMDLPLNYTFYRAVLGKPLDMFDISRFDPQLGTQLEKLWAALQAITPPTPTQTAPQSAAAAEGPVSPTKRSGSAGRRGCNRSGSAGRNRSRATSPCTSPTRPGAAAGEEPQAPHAKQRGAGISGEVAAGRGASPALLGPVLVDGVAVDDLCITFTLPGDAEFELVPGGQDQMVTSQNLGRWIEAVVDATVGSGIAAQVEAFQEGFNEVFLLASLDTFYEDEIETMLCGAGEHWTVQGLLEEIKFDHGYTASSPVVKALVEVLAELDPLDQRRFLRFVTGCPRLPPGGLSSLQPRLTVVRKQPSGGEPRSPSTMPGTSLKDTLGVGTTLADGDLPSVMTCANYIKLPPYSAKHVLRERSSPCGCARQEWPRTAVNAVHRRPVLLLAAKTQQPVAKYSPKDARDAIETALRIHKEQKDYDEAARLYTVAMEMKPTDDEARAALYNMGCVLVKQKQWAPAAACVVKAINDYGLKLSVALQDADLKELRDRREWVDALMEVKGGLSRNAKIDLRSEAKSPFRLPRIILFSGVCAGAGLGLFIITGRLIAALQGGVAEWDQGGPDAPDLTETLQNFGINSVAVAILGFLVYRDVQSKQKADHITDREETLGRLQLDLGSGRQLPLIRFRGLVRPVILSGTRTFVESAIEASRPYYQDLRERGVCVVPVILDEVDQARRSSAADPEARIRALKEQLQREKEAGSAKGFGQAKPGPATQEEEEAQEQVGLGEAAKKWRLKAFDVIEWREWMEAQRAFVNMPADSTNVYVQVQLDGTVRTSGRGRPNWEKLVADLPPLDDVRTRFTDGIGTDI
ncbi:hypothetical protein QJQ45_025630 [Haematococcus lacustris]|nr:hypothetical protein QJQ45_025630 [Haematococcus lacustris]